MDPINEIYIKQEVRNSTPTKNLLYSYEKSYGCEMEKLLQCQAVENFSRSNVNCVIVSNKGSLSTLPVPSLSQYTCAMCLKLCSTIDMLIRHVFSHYCYINIPLHICYKCDQIFLKFSMLSAHNLHHNKKPAAKELSLFELVCVVCSQSFSSWCSLTEHVFNHTPAISAPLYVCTCCSEVFEDLAKLHFHKYTSRTKKERVYCEKQSYKRHFPSAKPLNKSMPEETFTICSCSNNRKCWECNKSPETDNQNIYGSDPPFLGEVCAKYFMHKNLKVHQKMGIGKLSFSSKFTASGNEYHLDERLFLCEFCGKTFKTLQNLEVHRRTHTGDRPFPCEVCGKSFRHSGALKIHRRIHFGIRPYSCDVCRKCFTQSGDLTVHKRYHSGERPYSCEVCGKSFVRSQELRAHQRIHSGIRPFSCEICSKSFTEANNLRKHKKYHSAERPYCCEVCKKSFIEYGHFKRHRKIHYGASIN